MTRRNIQIKKSNLRATEITAIIPKSRRQILILIVALFSSRLSRYTFAVSPREMWRHSALPGWSERRIRKARAVLVERGFLLPYRKGKGGIAPDGSGIANLYTLAQG